MNNRLQSLVYGAVLAAIIGWVLYIGKDVFVPIVFGVLVVYVIVGLTRLLYRVPYLGRVLPLEVRYTVSVLIIGLGFSLVVYLFLAHRDAAIALAPQYQGTLLAAIQKVAVFLHVESEPTWATLRQDLFAQINLQRLIGSLIASLSSILVSVVVVLLYTAFLLVEQRSFDTKLANLSSDPSKVARIRQVTNDINARIGSYLALKTFISLLLGALSWVTMKFVGLEFAGVWAVLITMLNYVPYIGSFLGVLFPVALSIVQFTDPTTVFVVFIALTIIQFLIGTILDPYVMGNSLNLSPFAILVSLAIWSALWGIPGAFLAVPITAIMTIIFSEFEGTRPIAILLSRSGQL
jgi:AI-2 transport protein TqsA